MSHIDDKSNMGASKSSSSSGSNSLSIATENKMLKEIICLMFANRYKHSLELKTVKPDDKVKLIDSDKPECVWYEYKGPFDDNMISRECGEPIESYRIDSKEISISSPNIYTLNDFSDELEKEFKRSSVEGYEFDEDKLMMQYISKDIDNEVNKKLKELTSTPVSNLKQYIEKELKEM